MGVGGGTHDLSSLWRFDLVYLRKNTASQRRFRGGRRQNRPLGKKEREFSLAESNLKDFGLEIDLLDGTFLSEGTFVDFLRLLESLAKKTGVKFSAQNARLPQSDKEMASLNFEITGNFRGVADFFALLDKIPYAGIVDSANISPKAEGQKGTGAVTARINYIIFNFKI